MVRSFKERCYRLFSLLPSAGSETSSSFHCRPLGEAIIWLTGVLCWYVRLLHYESSSERVGCFYETKAAVLSVIFINNTPCLKKKLCKLIFCQNFAKFRPIVKNFGTKIAERTSFSEVYSFSTSLNLCQRTTVWNADVQNCHITR